MENTMQIPEITQKLNKVINPYLARGVIEKATREWPYNYNNERDSWHLTFKTGYDSLGLITVKTPSSLNTKYELSVNKFQGNPEVFTDDLEEIISRLGGFLEEIEVEGNK